MSNIHRTKRYMSLKNMKDMPRFKASSNEVLKKKAGEQEMINNQNYKEELQKV